MRVCGNGDDEERRLPLSTLDLDEHSCVHGGLHIEISGRLVPNMGFFGEDDVCLGEWLANFQEIDSTFRSNEKPHCAFHSGEMGDPEFVFEREGENGFLSLVSKEPFGDGANPDWQRIEFNVADFFVAHAEFRRDIENWLDTEAPHCGRQWLAERS